MPFCKACGTYYTKSLGVCPKCNEAEVLAQLESEPTPPQEPPEGQRNALRRRWLGIVLGIPALIAFIYALYYIRMVLQS